MLNGHRFARRSGTGCLLTVPEGVVSFIHFFYSACLGSGAAKRAVSVGRCKPASSPAAVESCVYSFRQVFQQRIRPSSTLASRWFACVVGGRVCVLGHTRPVGNSPTQYCTTGTIQAAYPVQPTDRPAVAVGRAARVSCANHRAVPLVPTRHPVLLASHSHAVPPCSLLAGLCFRACTGGPAPRKAGPPFQRPPGGPRPHARRQAFSSVVPCHPHVASTPMAAVGRNRSQGPGSTGCSACRRDSSTGPDPG